MSLRYIDDFDIKIQIEVIKTYLYDGMSHRAIQKEILGLPAPARGGGFIVMNILHYYDIRDNKKEILKIKSIDSEMDNASKDYKKALILLKTYNKYENRVIEKIENKSLDFNIPIDETETLSTVKQRIAQDILRKYVIKNYNNSCAICDIDIPDLLICSHIKPWAIDEKNRLNPSNSICLCTWHDSLFDRGYISFDEKYNILISSKLSLKTKKELCILNLKLPNSNKPDKDLIKYHRENIFRA